MSICNKSIDTANEDIGLNDLLENIKILLNYIIKKRKNKQEERSALFFGRREFRWYNKHMAKKIEKNVVIYQAKSGAIELRGDFSSETIWATQDQNFSG